jgi:hypothetical protein
MNALVSGLRTRDGLYQVTGRLDDFVVEGDAIVTAQAATTHSLAPMGVVTYCLSEGTRLYADHLPEEAKNALSAAFQRNNLQGRRGLADSVAGLINLLREPVHVAVIILDAANCFPAVDRSFLSEDQLGLRERVARLGTALWLKKNGNAFVLVADAGTIDSTIEAAATKIKLSPPDKVEKATFLEALGPRYPNARFADDITLADAARLISGTTNRATEALVRRAHVKREPITAKQLNKQKQDALLEQTHGVLRLLDTTDLPALVGIYLGPAMQMLKGCCNGLLRGDRNLSPMIVLHGPPGVGKTLAAKWAAATSNIMVLELQSQRAPHVGEAEQRTRTLHEKRIDPAFTPNLLVTDELAHIPTSRDGNDGGVTETQFSDWLSSLSDPRSRQSIVLATMNMPEGLPAALQSRCEFFPVFSPSVNDLAAILAHRCAELGLADGDDVCLAAAQHIASKGGSPRDLDRMMRRLAQEPRPTWQDFSTAANNLLVPDRQWQAALYCDYWSLLTMTDRTCIPWRDRTEMPAHLAAVINDNGEINYDEVRARLKELGHVKI